MTKTFIVTAPDGREYEIDAPDDATQGQILSYAQQEIAKYNTGSEFSRGLERGTAGVGALISEGIPALAKSIVGVENKENLQEYQRKTQEAAQEYPTAYPSFTDVHGLGDAGSYFASALGEGLPSMATAMVGGGVGGAIAKTAARNAMLRAGAKELSDEAITAATVKGLGYGTYAASQALNTPETYMNLLSQGKDDPALSLVIGSAKSYLDTIVPTTQLAKLFGTEKAADILTGTWLRRMGLEGAKAFGMEGLTEGAQEGLDILAENLSGLNPDMFNAENFVRVADAGLKGAIPGGVVGSVTQGVSELRNKQGTIIDEINRIRKAVDNGQPVPEAQTAPAERNVFPEFPPAPEEETDAQREERLARENSQAARMMGHPALNLQAPELPEVPSFPAEQGIAGLDRVFDSTMITPTHLLEQEQAIAEDNGISPETLATMSMEERQRALAHIEDQNKRALAMKKIAEDTAEKTKQRSLLETFTEGKDIAPVAAKIKLDNPKATRAKQTQMRQTEIGDQVFVNDDPNGEIFDVIGMSDEGVEVNIGTAKPFTIPHGMYTKFEPKKQKIMFQKGVPQLNPSVLQQQLGVGDGQLDLRRLTKPVALAFHRVGADQRGEPEILMTKAQGAMGGGVMSYAIEHTGDLINRMTAHQFLDHGREYVTDKVEKVLSSLKSQYGFEKEFKENLESNARYRKEPLDAFKDLAFQSLQLYADAHRKLPVYNRAQWLAREAAIALGERNIPKAVKYLEELKAKTRSKKEYLDAVTEYVAGPDEYPVQYSPHYEVSFQKKLTASEEFQKWFAGSKVINEDGTPKKMYHGTSKDKPFKTFRVSRRGAWFTEDPKDANSYAEQNDSQGHRFEGWNVIPTNTRGRIIPVYLSIKNPYKFTTEDNNKLSRTNSYQKTQREIFDKAKRLGHDGVIFGSVAVVFDKSQIRSALSDKEGRTFQKGTPQDLQGDAYNDVLLHGELANGVMSTPFTGPATEQQKTMMDMVKRIAKETLGTVNIEYFNRLIDEVDGNPAFGAQFRNTIMVALNADSTNAQVMQTAYHEVWHMLERRGLISDQMIATMEAQTGLLKDYVDQDGYLSKQDFNMLMSDPVMREEIRANAFGKYAMDYFANKYAPTSLPTIFRTMFRKGMNFLTRLKNGLNGLGFRTTADIFDSAIEGQFANQNINQMRDAIQHARLMKGSENIQNRTNAERRADAEDKINTYSKEAMARAITEEKPVYHGMWTQSFRSPYDLANRDAMAAYVYLAQDRRQRNANTYTYNFQEALKDYIDAPRNIRQAAASTADKVSMAKRKAWISDGSDLRQQGPKGSLNWRAVNEQGVEEWHHIDDPAVGKAYVSLQAYFSKVLDSYEELLINQGYTAHSDVLPAEYTSADVALAEEDAKAKRHENATAEKTYLSLKNLRESMEAIKKMRLVDYFPGMRFGPYAFAVHDMHGNLVALYNIEQGYRVPGGKDQVYNRPQLDKAKAELKAKYSDMKRFKIYGHDKENPIVNIDNAIPFTMNYNDLKKGVNERLLTTELMFSLYHGKGIETEMFKDTKAEIIKDITERKFERRFSESHKVPGYSQDYERVINAHLKSAAHFLATENFASEMSALEVELGKLAGSTGTLKDTLKQQIEYNQSPQEDLQEFRTVNFLWAMGLNLSSALLQIMTLPFMTLGLMTMYSPNIIRNMQLISKHFILANKALLRNKNLLGESVIDFNQIIYPSTEVRVREAAAYAANEHWAKEGRLAGMAFENQGKLRTREMETREGKILSQMDVFSRLLGKPISFMEQVTRYATLNATRELLATDPAAAETARKIFADNPLVQEIIASNNELGIDERQPFPVLIAEWTMDSAHGVFGKQGRPGIYKGVGGAFIFPFQTYNHYTLEGMARMYGMGREGKRGLATTIAVMFLVGGLMGLPGADALKELLEWLEKYIDGSEEDIRLIIEQKMHNLTGDMLVGELLTGGLTRAGGVDVSTRTGTGIPGQEILLSMLGVRGQPTSVAGVQGSILTGIGEAVKSYTDGDSGLEVGAALMPVGVSNVLKALSYGTEGKRSKQGVQLITPEDVTATTKVLQAFGIRSTQIAEATEKAYYSNLLENKYKVGIDRFRARVTNIKTDLMRARASNDMKRASELQDKLQEEMQDLRDYVQSNQIPSFPWPSFNKTTSEKARENATGIPSLRKVNKAARRAVQLKDQMYGE